jgi:transcriptional regulator of acetoin/glycerol metabolism
MYSRRFAAPRADRAEESPLALPEFDEALTHLPLRDARRLILEHFERRYLVAMLDRADGNVAEAARRAGIDRVTLFRAIRRYGLRAA